MYKLFWTLLYSFIIFNILLGLYFLFIFKQDSVSTTIKVLPKDVNLITQNDFRNYAKKYCPVEIITNVYNCLDKLSEYDTRNLTVNVYKIFYHTFWDLSGNKLLKYKILRLQILSYLATQDLVHTQLIIWALKPLDSDVDRLIKTEFSGNFNKSNVHIKIIDLQELCLSGLYIGYYKNCTNTSPKNLVSFSDFLRFLILYNYGGIYVDGDVIFLRDLKPFWDTNFVYRWSFHAINYNTAVMGISKELKASILNIYKEMLKAWSMHPWRMSNIVAKINNGGLYNYTSLDVYNSALFDPAWICDEGFLLRKDPKTICKFEDFYDFKINKNEFNFDNFFKGAFTYHIHLKDCGSCVVRVNSYFHHLETYFKSIITSNHTNKVM